jgi:putative hemolysin
MFTYLKIRKVVKSLDRAVVDNGDVDIVNDFLKQLKVSYSIADQELKNIPVSGPYIVLANHPFDFIDSLMLLDIFLNEENDFKIVADIQKKELSVFKRFFIEPGKTGSGKISTGEVNARCATHLKNGKSLAVFLGDIRESEEFRNSLVNLITETGASVVPLYFYGAKNSFSNVTKLLPFSLRSWLNSGNLVNYGHPSVKLRIGKVVESGDVVSFGSNAKSFRYLNACVYALGSQVAVKRFFKKRLKPSRHVEPVIDAVAPAEIEMELEVLRNNGGLLQSKGSYEIYLGQTEVIPNILREIGRLREITFREVGEGTNQKLDLDSYDVYYNHLFVWDKDEKCIIGAYRLGRGKDIIGSHGVGGFYVTSLFSLDEPLIPVLAKTLELGRSFVVKKYQQKPLPLFLLWQGILCFLRENKEYQYLMGPVSISNDFTMFSKDLMIAFIKKHYYDYDLARHVHPHQEFVVKTDQEDIDVILERSPDLQELDKFISSIEPNYLKVPVLIKQYIRQNAKIIAFNVDPLFNDCLDGLMILNLNDVPADTYEMLQSR